MIGVFVSVPIACFRKGLAREYLETHRVPPPATCYGFLLSLVGETSRARHVGCRIAPGMLNQPDQSVVLRTVWRVKKTPLGSPGNSRPDYQQLLTDARVCIWLDSSDEVAKRGPNLELRVREALTNPSLVSRFGGLSLGESTHLVDEVSLINEKLGSTFANEEVQCELFLLQDCGRLTLPVWVDHVGSSGTGFATGNLEPHGFGPPEIARMPVIVSLA